MSLFTGLLSAELKVFLPLLDNFLTALQVPGVNTEAAVADYAHAQLGAIQSLPTAESTGINVVAATAQAHLNKIVSTAPAIVKTSSSIANSNAAES